MSAKAASRNALVAAPAAADVQGTDQPICSCTQIATISPMLPRTPVLCRRYAHAHWLPPVEVELRIVGRRHGVRAVKVEQVCATAQHALLHGAAAPEAKVVQAAAQQGARFASLHAGIKGGLDDVTRPAARRGNGGGVPVAATSMCTCMNGWGGCGGL